MIHSVTVTQGKLQSKASCRIGHRQPVMNTIPGQSWLHFDESTNLIQIQDRRPVVRSAKALRLIEDVEDTSRLRYPNRNHLQDEARIHAQSAQQAKSCRQPDQPVPG
jgi:hypothetical protein